MKKITILLLCCLLTLLPACGGGSDVPEDLDLEQVYQAILSAQGDGADELVMFSEEEDGSYVTSTYPGLTDVARKQTVIYVAPVSGFATEVVLVEVENSSDVATVQDIFEARIETAQDDAFYPDTAAQWQNAQVQTAGNYVGMIVLPDGFTVPDDVFSLVSQ